MYPKSHGIHIYWWMELSHQTIFRICIGTWCDVRQLLSNTESLCWWCLWVLEGVVSIPEIVGPHGGTSIPNILENVDASGWVIFHCSLPYISKINFRKHVCRDAGAGDKCDENNCNTLHEWLDEVEFEDNRGGCCCFVGPISYCQADQPS